MAKGKVKDKVDLPSTFEEYQEALRKPFGSRSSRWGIPSRSDGPDVYPRFRLHPPRPVKWQPLWVNLLILTILISPCVGLVVYSSSIRPDAWFFLFVIGLLYIALVTGIISMWHPKPRMNIENDVGDEDETL